MYVSLSLSLSIYIYICMYVCICIYIYIYVYIYIYIYIYTHTCISGRRPRSNDMYKSDAIKRARLAREDSGFVWIGPEEVNDCGFLFQRPPGGGARGARGCARSDPPSPRCLYHCMSVGLHLQTCCKSVKSCESVINNVNAAMLATISILHLQDLLDLQHVCKCNTTSMQSYINPLSIQN